MPTPVELQRLQGIDAVEATAVNDADGRLQLFARSVRGELYTLAQAVPGGLFSPSWSPLGLDAASAPAAALGSDDKLALFVRGRDGQIHHTRKTIANHLSFAPWTSIGGWRSLEPPQVALGPDGLLRVFAPGDDECIWSIAQLNPQKDLWSTWRPVTHPIASRPQIARDREGRLHLFVRGSNAAVWQYTLDHGGTWEASSLGGVIEGTPAVVWNPALARFEVFARAANRAIWQCAETRPGVFSSWRQMGYHPSLASDAHGQPIYAVGPQVIANADGRLEIFVTGEGQRYVWHAAEVAPGSGWTSWSPMLLGETAGPPSIARGADGRIEIFFIDSGASVARASQSAPGAWREPRHAFRAAAHA